VTLTVSEALASALAAYEALTSLGEDVEDEWTYVTDLSSAWRERLEAVDAARGAEPVTDVTAAAIDRAIDEIGRISDPHRAIDWLSTFPHVVALALGGDVDGPEGAAAGSRAGDSPQDPDDDSPFGMLRSFR